MNIDGVQLLKDLTESMWQACCLDEEAAELLEELLDRAAGIDKRAHNLLPVLIALRAQVIHKRSVIVLVPY
jgi:hypothetical protein